MRFCGFFSITENGDDCHHNQKNNDQSEKQTKNPTENTGNEFHKPKQNEILQ